MSHWPQTTPIFPVPRISPTAPRRNSWHWPPSRDTAPTAHSAGQQLVEQLQLAEAEWRRGAERAQAEAAAAAQTAEQLQQRLAEAEQARQGLAERLQRQAEEHRRARGRWEEEASSPAAFETRCDVNLVAVSLVTVADSGSPDEVCMAGERIVFQAKPLGQSVVLEFGFGIRSKMKLNSSHANSNPQPLRHRSA